MSAFAWVSIFSDTTLKDTWALLSIALEISLPQCRITACFLVQEQSSSFRYDAQPSLQQGNLLIFCPRLSLPVAWYTFLITFLFWSSRHTKSLRQSRQTIHAKLHGSEMRQLKMLSAASTCLTWGSHSSARCVCYSHYFGHDSCAISLGSCRLPHIISSAMLPAPSLRRQLEQLAVSLAGGCEIQDVDEHLSVCPKA
ncbi:hypothetical protein EDB19DRAFT_290218 [Suillus lakei]|nr:hypothetical protein EDB19DRAFT_290218 [Suillus lakei]